MMKKLLLLLIACFVFSQHYAQLKEVKLLVPKEIPFAMNDYAQFLPDEKYFVVLGNSLSVFNTETCEIIDDYELNAGAKNLSISSDGKYILVTVGPDVYIFSFTEQKLKLIHKTSTAELIKGQPNSQYYGLMPVSGCFFTSQPGQFYAAIGAFTVIYDFLEKKAIASHSLPQTDYVLHAIYYRKRNEAILAHTSGTLNIISKQLLDDLSKVEEVTTNRMASYKIKLKDSLLFCLNLDVYYAMDLETKKVVHEVRAPKIDYSDYSSVTKEFSDEMNRRPAITMPDTTNFLPDEAVYDIDYLPQEKTLVYATRMGMRFISLTSRKQLKFQKGLCFNLRLSPSGNRMVTNGYTAYKSLRIYDPKDLKLLSERTAMGSSIFFIGMSPGNKWLYTSSGASGFIWNLSNFTKHAEIKDLTKNDSSFAYNGYFLNDSEIVVNYGSSQKDLKLGLYDIQRKKFKKTIKAGVQTWASGFMNGEYYYCTLDALHIIDLKTMREEKYEGLFSAAFGNMYNIVSYTDDLVFIPEAGKFKVINRKTKKTEYQSENWALSKRAMVRDKSVFTAAMFTKKKNFNGVDVDMPVNAIVKIDLAAKAVKDYAETYNPYDFKLKNNGKTIAIWYEKYDLANYDVNSKESVYSEYNVETGEQEYTKTLIKMPGVIQYHFTSDSGKYFAFNTLDNMFKVFNAKGEEILDLSDMNLYMPKCFFIEQAEILIVTSNQNAVATFIDLKQKKVMGKMVNATGDNYFMVTEDMHYLGSKEFVKNIRFKYGSELFSFDQFDAYLNQPHHVLRAFKCSDSTIIEAYEKAYLKRMRVLGLKPDTKLNFSVLPNIQSVVTGEEKEGKVSFSVGANKGKNNLAGIEVLNNGTRVYTEAIKPGQAARYENTLQFETSSGINRFEFIVRDDKGLESPRITRFVNNTNQVKPDLYLVVIASEKFKNSDFDLSYALKDASDVANTMAGSKSFGTVHTKKMVNKSFSPDSVKALNEFFSKAGINDLVMVFYAGHGYLDKDFSYYFPTYYTDFSDPKINSVAYNAFEKLFKEMKPTRKLMFIDACFSGEVDMEEIKQDKKKKNSKDSTRTAASGMFSQSTALEMSKAVFSDLRLNSGATVISSAGGTEAAYEDEKWNNGLFTYCMLNGMKNLKADANNDKKITLNELQKYVSEEVNRLSEGKQTPTYRVENTVLDYELWQ